MNTSPATVFIKTNQSNETMLIPVHESILQQRRDGIDVVFAHLSNVLEQEGEGLQYTVLHVELRHAVFVH